MKRWLIGGALVLVCILAGLYLAAERIIARFEPSIREQAIRYLSDRFHSDVQIAALHVSIPNLSVPKALLNRGAGTMAAVRAEGVALTLRGANVPLFRMQHVSFSVDLGVLGQDTKTIEVVTIDGLEINVPPKGERPKTDSRNAPKVTIGRVEITNARLALLPKDAGKTPLEFQIAKLHMRSAGNATAMAYDATLTIPKPPGDVQAKGSFGPWDADEPGNSPLNGDYQYRNADLGVFRAIAGKLDSTGHFEGQLSSLQVKGEANVPDFQLRSSGNPVPLRTQFDALVDGTNGNTVLQPVRAKLGSTSFTTSGSVLKHEDLGRRAILLTANIPDGQLRDLLRLSMKGSPFMEGRVSLKTKIAIPPLTQKVIDKLDLDGNFEVRDGKFLRSNIQEQVDQLSRRGQGQPKNQEIDEVVSLMRGSFRLDDRVLTFRSLTFGVPGADVDLAGNVDLGADQVDLHGALRLRAKVSQTMSGWKRWALKPVDPFFSKNGAGTYLKIRVVGSTRKPQFGLDKK